MAEQKKKHAPSKTENDQVEEVPTESASDVEIDDLLDEIDGVLEENAAEFVTSFVQKGGE
jgi:ubiquitin-like protein Pup